MFNVAFGYGQVVQDLGHSTFSLSICVPPPMLKREREGSCADLFQVVQDFVHQPYLSFCSNCKRPSMVLRCNTFRTEIKGGGLQVISSSQFSVPAFSSKNFLDSRKLLRTVLSGF